LRIIRSGTQFSNDLSWNAKTKPPVVLLVEATPQVADTVIVEVVSREKDLQLIILTEIPHFERTVNFNCFDITLGLQLRDGAC
jgi:hypothetical protein